MRTIENCRQGGLGADGSVFLRTSRYSFPGFRDIDQRNPQQRVFMTSHTGG